jgi:hypothetical protein
VIIKKPVEVVYELKKDEYQVPSFEEFMKSYESGSKVNYADLIDNNLETPKRYGPCIINNLLNCDNCRCSSEELDRQLKIIRNMGEAKKLGIGTSSVNQRFEVTFKLSPTDRYFSTSGSSCILDIGGDEVGWCSTGSSNRNMWLGNFIMEGKFYTHDIVIKNITQLRSLASFLENSTIRIYEEKKFFDDERRSGLESQVLVWVKELIGKYERGENISEVKYDI